MLYTASYNRTSQGGFSLVEMMIVIGIITLITVAVMVRHSSFNSLTVLQNAAYEVAFDIRQVQSRAVSPQSGGDGNFRGGYSFELDLNLPSQYTINEHRSSNIVNPIEITNIDNRYEIDGFVIVDGLLSADYSQFQIFFERPQFDAVFLDSSGQVIPGAEGAIVQVCERDASRIINRTDFPGGTVDAFDVVDFLSVAYGMEPQQSMSELMQKANMLGVFNSDAIERSHAETMSQIAIGPYESSFCSAKEGRRIWVSNTGQISVQ